MGSVPAPEQFAGHNLIEILPGAVLAPIRQAEEEVRNSTAMQLSSSRPRGGPARRATKCDCCRELGPVDRHRPEHQRPQGDEQRLKQYVQELERKNEELESAVITAREATRMKSLPGQPEPRDPHSHERGSGDDGLPAGHPPDPRAGEYTESVKRSADSLMALINDILDLSRIGAGKLRLDRLAFPLRGTIEETASFLGAQARAKRVGA
jgi:signal transduction histidine kinase